mmetsp:Transcript_56640/g.106751  ORF Transcript_56640/g.106751 Transcript_56640/m.106751 type:complete len:227 (-) Transcript_56640:114-794(-)
MVALEASRESFVYSGVDSGGNSKACRRERDLRIKRAARAARVDSAPKRAQSLRAAKTRQHACDEDCDAEAEAVPLQVSKCRPVTRADGCTPDGDVEETPAKPVAREEAKQGRTRSKSNKRHQQQADVEQTGRRSRGRAKSDAVAHTCNGEDSEYDEAVAEAEAAAARKRAERDAREAELNELHELEALTAEAEAAVAAVQAAEAESKAQEADIDTLDDIDDDWEIL